MIHTAWFFVKCKCPNSYNVHCFTKSLKNLPYFFFQENCQCVLMHNSTRFLLRLFRICFSKCETSYGPSFYSIELPHLYVDGPDSYVSTVLNQKSTVPKPSFIASQFLTIWWTWLHIFLPAARFTIFMGQKEIRHLVSVIHNEYSHSEIQPVQVSKAKNVKPFF